MLFFLWCSFSEVVVSGPPGPMFSFVCAEGQNSEFFGGGGGVFPFKVAEFSRRKRFFVTLSLEEFRSLATKWVRFCTFKGYPSLGEDLR